MQIPSGSRLRSGLPTFKMFMKTLLVTIFITKSYRVNNSRKYLFSEKLYVSNSGNRQYPQCVYPPGHLQTKRSFFYPNIPPPFPTPTQI